MPPKMKDNQFYVVEVPVPDGLTAAEAEQLVEDLAKGLGRADHRMKGRTNKNYQPSGNDVAPVASTSTMQPLYFCHNKF